MHMSPSQVPPSAAPLADARLSAVLSRDWRADGGFVYAVITTGVYCRPSCPSRRPKPSNIRFFDHPDDAERAGFRPCQRCAPREAGTTTIRAVERARAWIDTHGDEPATLATLGRVAGLSPFHLQRSFKRLTGMTPHEYAASRRALALRDGLRQGESVTGAVYDAGYGSSSRAYERASAQLGMTPGAYKRGAPDTHIAFHVADSALGRVLIAATDRGLCRVAFGASDAQLTRDLAREFPGATLEPRAEALGGWVREILDRIEGAEPHIDVPLDVRASAFQWRVWRALQAIPPGVTRSYAAIARTLGRPTASRAVARACATNPVAVVIPCHRAVRSNGTLGGYRWGTARKAGLLDGEAAGRKRA
jgi:AraC family transcriptional regulator of adaptative response/methylated-DNA-[protein]-cysteine methyltransferase